MRRQIFHHRHAGAELVLVVNINPVVLQFCRMASGDIDQVKLRGPELLRRFPHLIRRIFRAANQDRQGQRGDERLVAGLKSPGKQHAALGEVDFFQGLSVFDPRSITKLAREREKAAARGIPEALHPIR